MTIDILWLWELKEDWVFLFLQFPYEVLIQKTEVTRWIRFTSCLKRGQWVCTVRRAIIIWADDLSSLNIAKKCFAFKMGWIIIWSFFTDECRREININSKHYLPIDFCVPALCYLIFTFVYPAYSLNSTCYGLLLRCTPSWMLIAEWRACFLLSYMLNHFMLFIY